MTKQKKIAMAIGVVVLMGVAIFFFGPKKVIKQVAQGNQGTASTRAISKDDVSSALTPYFMTEEAESERASVLPESNSSEDVVEGEGQSNPSANPPATMPKKAATTPKGKTVTKAVSYDGKANTEMEAINGDFQKIFVTSKLDSLEQSSLTKSICEHLDPTFLAVCYDKTIYTQYIAFVRTAAARAVESEAYGKEIMTGTDQDLDIELVFDTEAKIITLTIEKNPDGVQIQ